MLFTRIISPDSSRVVYLTDQDTNGVNALYSVPIGGGTVPKLNAPLPNNADVGVLGIKLSLDGTRAVHSADQDTNNVHELFSVLIAGGTITPVSIPGDNLFNYDISADGNTVVYQTSAGGTGLDELFSVPLLGGPVTQLNAPVPSGETVGFFEISADSTTVTYTTELIVDNEAPSTALFSVPINGGNPVQLTPDFAVGSGTSRNDISPDSSFVVYRADQDTPGTRELYGIDLNGGDRVKLNGPLVTGGDVSSIRFTSDSNRIIYRADQDSDEVDELYSVARGSLGRPDFVFEDGFE